MSANLKPVPAVQKLPYFAEAQAFLNDKVHAREAPYLSLLPGLIFGALLFLAASGLVLAVYYVPAHGFDSVQSIDRDVANGWLIHGFHETGTTMLFGAVYLYLFRGLYTRGYKAPAELVWVFGVAQFTLLLLVGWLGYVLADGAVSGWSLTSAANDAALLTGLPGAAGTWFFGGLAGAGTLARLLVFHTVLALAVLGIAWLHHAGARLVAPQPAPREAVSFHPYYTAQYFVAFVVFALIFSVFVFFAPHFGENHLNLAPADPLVVPELLTPPWYLAPLSALGAALPGIYGGLLGVIAALAVLFALPWLDRSGPNARHGFFYKFLTVLLALDVLGLGLAGAAGALGGILTMLFTAWYFLHFLVLTPLVTALEAE